jgi:hypothetical protein
MFDVASGDVDDVGCCANGGCIIGRWTWLVNLGHYDSDIDLAGPQGWWVRQCGV